MGDYQVQPWDNLALTNPKFRSIDLNMYVPPEIEKLADKVISFYDLKVKERHLITSKPDKGGAIWRIKTNKGMRSLKLLHREPRRSRFSVEAQQYVVKKGARVPALIPTKKGQLCHELGGKTWIVTDWVSPLTQATKIDLKGAQALCYGLGEFHKHSKGYVPSGEANVASRLHKWPKHYAKIINKIDWFRVLAKLYKENPASRKLLSVIDTFEKQAQNALAQLENSAYYKMVSMGEPYWGLVHQDYGWSNGQMGPKGIWVIDLDGVAYDLPIRDLRKLITSTMDDMGVWDIKWMRGMIEAYHKANPLSQEMFKILLIDMAMPNEFYKHCKEMLYDPETFFNTEFTTVINKLMLCEKTKWKALDQLSKDIGKYKKGKYDPPANDNHKSSVYLPPLSGTMKPLTTFSASSITPLEKASKKNKEKKKSKKTSKHKSKNKSPKKSKNKAKTSRASNRRKGGSR